MAIQKNVVLRGTKRGKRSLKFRRKMKKRYREGDELPGGYVVDEIIARGGSGLVLKAHKPKIKPPIYKAIKLINTESPQGRERRNDIKKEFYGEAKVSFEIGSDPYAVGVEDILEMEDNSRALVFPFIEGSSLHALNQSHIKAGRLIPFELTAFMFHRILSVLSHAHGRGIAHRDLCTSNVMVQRTGVPMLLDWGAGTEVNQGILIGKPGYIAPEVVSAPDSLSQEDYFRADIFSLGALVRELLVGHNAFDFEDDDGNEMDPYDILDLREEINCDTLLPVHEICADIPKVLSDIVTACMKHNPKDRPGIDVLYDYVGSKYLYTSQVGFGATTETLEDYLKFCQGIYDPDCPLSQDSFGRNMKKIIISKARRKAEDPESKNLILLEIARQQGLDDKFGNVHRTFRDAYGPRLMRNIMYSLAQYLHKSNCERNGLPMGATITKETKKVKTWAKAAPYDELVTFCREQVRDETGYSGSELDGELNWRVFSVISQLQQFE